MRRILSSFLLLAVLLASCAPGVSGTSAALARFPMKTQEQWQMLAFKPGNFDSLTYPLELYDEPEFDDDAIVANAEAGKYEASVIFDPEDNFLFVLVSITRGSDPEIVLCGFPNATAGKPSYPGTSFFGRASELRDLGRFGRDRFARCELSKK